jgi:hypothetical protein
VHDPIPASISLWALAVIAFQRHVHKTLECCYLLALK